MGELVPGDCCGAITGGRTAAIRYEFRLQDLRRPRLSPSFGSEISTISS